jgi:hypothetical protein
MQQWHNSTIELKTVKTANNNNNNKQQNTITVNTLKAIPKCYNVILVVSKFVFFVSLSQLCWTYTTIAFSERYSL